MALSNSQRRQRTVRVTTSNPSGSGPKFGRPTKASVKPKAKPKPNALPPGRQGGPLATTPQSKPENPRRTGARQRQQAAATGTRGSGVRTGQPAPSTPRGGGLLRGLKNLGVGGTLGAASTVAAIADTARNIVDPNSQSSTNLRNAKNAVMRKMGGGPRKAERGARPDSRSRSQGIATSWQGPTKSGQQRRSAPAPTPTPSPSPSSRPSGGGGGSSYRAPSPSPAPSSSSRPSPSPAPSPKPESSKGGGGAYGADGKQLYMAHKKNNPLMKRTFGYQTGEGPKKKDGDKGPVSGVGPVASGDKYAAKVGQNRGQKSVGGGGGRAAMAGSKSGPVTAQAKKEQSIMERIAEMKKRSQSS